MKRRILIAMLLFIVSCKLKNTNWKVIDFEVFKLSVPTEWERIKQQGIDSYVGGLTNKRDTLWFDYGRYAVNLTNDDNIVYKAARDTVNGLLAEIVIPKSSLQGTASMFLTHVNAENKFTIYGSNLNSIDTILKIFKSIIFKESDTSKNPPLTVNKFSGNTFPAEKLFKADCASCHKISQDFTGPALREVFKIRSKEWVYNYLVDRKYITSDSITQKLKAKYEFSCLKFPRLTKEDVYAIYYLAQEGDY